MKNLHLLQLGFIVCIATTHAAIAQNLTKPNIICLGGISVNSYTGNMFYQRSDLYIPGQGLSLDVTFSYNSGETGKDFGYGPGWTHSYNILYEKIGQDVLIRRGDGRKDLFTHNGSGYIHPVGIFDSLEQYELHKFRLTTRYGIKYYFDDSTHRKLTKAEDRNGNTITLSYSGSFPAQIVDPSGRAVSLIWSGGRLAEIRDSVSFPIRTILFQYDEHGNPNQVTDPMLNSTRYSYDARSQLKKLTDNRSNVFSISYSDSEAAVAVISWLTEHRITYDTAGHRTILTERASTGAQSTTYTFDSQGRCIDIMGNCCGYHKHYAYDADNNITTFTDANGKDYLYTYDNRGNRLTETDPLGFTITRTYEAVFNNVTGMTDKRNNKTTYTYDSKGNLTGVFKPLGITESYTYDSHGNRTSFTNGNTNTTNYSYDANGYLTGVTHPMGSESFIYDNVGNILSSTDENGHTTTFEYDKLNQRTKSIDALGNQTTLSYDANNNLLSVTDANGHTVSHTYDILNRNTITTNPAGTTTRVYDERGNVLSSTDGKGFTTTYTYDLKNLLIGEKNPVGDSKTFTHDNNGNTLTETDFRGNITSFTYDALNRLLTRTDALSNVTTYTYDANGNALTAKDARNNTTSNVYDALNRLSTINYPIGSVSYSYDNDDNRVTETDANSHTTTYTFDSRDRNTSITDALGDITTYTYDAHGNRLTIIDPLGHVTTFSYDEVNRLLSASNPLGEATRHTYDGVGNEITTTLPNGNVITKTYDASDRLTSMTDLIGSAAAYAYDANSNKTSEADGNGSTTNFSYDALNRTTSVTDPKGRSTTFTYDKNSNLLIETDRNSHTSTHAYDAINRLTSTTDANGGIVSTGYDAAGNTISKTDPNGNVTEYEYDANNRLIRETFPDGSTKEYAYDAHGNVTSRKDNNGVYTYYNYDYVNRLLKRDYPGSNDDAFTYDADGRTLTANNANAAIIYSYDNADRMLSEYLNGKVTGYAYDIPGRTRTITYPGGKVIREQYDYRNRLVAVTELSSGQRNQRATSTSSTLAALTYDHGNNEATRNLGNGVSTTTTYNSNNWITSSEYKKASVRILKSTYVRDNEGNVLSVEELPESLNSEAYAYDNIDLLVDFKRGRISGGSIPSPTTWSRFDFNASGDRNSSESDAETLSYSSNSTHQYTGIHYSSGKSISPTYSLNGNMLAYDTSSYVYNDENELVSYSGSSVNAQYSSDPFGRRISKTVDGIQTKFFFYGARVIEERNDSDIVQASYVDCARIDDKIMMERNGKHYFYLSNHIGSIVAVVDDTAGVVEIYRYKPFGQPSIVLSSGIGNPYLFTGREWNTESQTYHYRARQYDPFIGRFLNPNTRGFIDGEIAQCYGGPLYYQQVPRPPWWVSPQPDNPYALTPLQPWMVGEWLKWFKRMLANPSIWEASLRDVDPDNVQDELVSTVNRQIDGINSQIKKLKEEYAYYADQTLLRKDTFADARLQWIPGEIDRLEKERAEWNKLLEEILKICEEISAPIRVM